MKEGVENIINNMLIELVKNGKKAIQGEGATIGSEKIFRLRKRVEISNKMTEKLRMINSYDMFK